MIQKTQPAAAVFTLFLKLLREYTGHFYCIRHQYRRIREARENLHDGKVMAHIDFSENYAEKYGCEVQAAHFGTRAQGVLYSKVRIAEKCINRFMIT